MQWRAVPVFLAIPAFTHTSAALGDMKWRRSRDLSPVEQFMCPLYGASTQSNVDKARLQLPVFSKAKKGLEMLPPLRDALALHNYQAMIWLQADHEHIQVPSAGTSAWIKEQDCLIPVWTRLPPISDACLQLVICACKSNARQLDAVASRKI